MFLHVLYMAPRHGDIYICQAHLVQATTCTADIGLLALAKESVNLSLVDSSTRTIIFSLTFMSSVILVNSSAGLAFVMGMSVPFTWVTVLTSSADASKACSSTTQGNTHQPHCAYNITCHNTTMYAAEPQCMQHNQSAETQ